jgi:hypothetical protein
MNYYITLLRQHTERLEADRHAQSVQAANEARDRLTPVEDRLSRLLATIPTAIKAEGLSLPTLQASLRGRWRGHAHPGEIGRALRRLGFERRRDWRDGARGYPAL